MTGAGYKYAPKPSQPKVRRSQAERALESKMETKFKSTFDKLFRPIARQGGRAVDQVQELRKVQSARHEELSAMFAKFDCTIADIQARLDRIENKGR